MSEPKWLTRKEVEIIHTHVIEAAGGSHGLRDANLLESAIARPLNHHAYGEDDIFQLAASYAEGIARNHAFVDGNKRTAWTTADVFLRKNGYAIEAREDDQHVTMMEQFGQGQITREQAGRYFQEHSRQLQQEQARSETEKQGIAQSWAEKKELNGDEPKEKPVQSPFRHR